MQYVRRISDLDRLPLPINILKTFCQQVTPKGTEWANAICPFHDDLNPSLSINLSSGSFNCFGCGKTGRFEELPGAPEAVPVAAYRYEDRQGNLRYYKIRYFPKDFLVYHADNQQLVPGLGPNKACLYNLRELEQRPNDPVYIVEGEKDVESLKSKGYLATTGGSAQSWENSFARELDSRLCTIIPDSDNAGKLWLSKVQNSFYPKVLPVCFLPEGSKDISEYLSRNGDIRRLEPSKDPAQSLGTPSRDATIEINKESEPHKRTYLIGGILPEKFPAIIYADGGQGKSLIAMMMGFCVVLGAPFLGRETQKGNVLYIDWELDKDEQVRRAYKICRGMGLERPPEGFYYLRASKRLQDLKDLAINEIQRLDIKLVILDSFGFACGGNAEKPSEIQDLREAVDNFGTTTLVVDHQAKPSQQEGKTANVERKPYGSVYKFNWARSVLKSERIAWEQNRLDLCIYQTKHNFGALASPLRIRLSFEDNKIMINNIAGSV